MRFLVLLFAFTLHAKPKVYDCFLFLNEVEILDIRLHEMDPVVDYFVIVEAFETFRGHPKELVFLKHADQFKEFAHKIIYFVIDRLIETANPWDREIAHRNLIASALKDCEEEDIILLSDVDEIVQAKGVSAIYQLLCADPAQIVAVNQKYIAKFLNAAPDPIPWRGTVATTYQNLDRHCFQQLRDMRYVLPAAPAEGWHFTYQGGIERELYKIGAFSHSELDTPQEHEARKKEWEENKYPVLEIDDSFPLYIRENQAHFEGIGFIKFFEEIITH